MFTMVSPAFINPLSEEGKQMVREMGSLEALYNQNVDLIEVITRSHLQDISDIPTNYVELALKRIEWYLVHNSKKYDHKVYNFLFNVEITPFDVISFYILCQAIGIRYGPNSRESRVMVESQGKIIENRLEKLSKGEREEVVNRILGSLLTQSSIKWTFFEELLSSKKLQLRDLLLDNGQIILDREEFLERFGDRITHRDPEKMYELVVGAKIKELIAIKMIMQKTEDYMNAVYEKAQREIEPNPLLLEVAEKVSTVLSESVHTYGYGGGGGVGAKASPLSPKAFPPCVKKVLEGIRSGGRNDAIILFLTPFISYARLYPGVFAENVTKRVSDVDPNLNAVQNEVLPMIFGAAERCSPPLFEDQPQEKVNINAKMGFGMHDALELKNEGETLWYTPMSCEKVKIHLPSLCKPDKTCKTIGNPLTYYNKVKRELKKGGAGEGEEGNGDGKSDETREAPSKG